MQSFMISLDNLIYDSKVTNNKELGEFCNKVKDFVMEGSFSSYKKVKFIMGFWGHTADYVEEMTGMKSGAVRAARKKISSELYDLFGHDFFTVVGVGDKKAIKEGEYRLYLAEQGFSSSNFVFLEILNDIRAKGTEREDIDISKCIPEMQFLARHSKSTIRRELEGLDLDKLLYLIRMLDNEAGTPVNIKNLIKFIEKGE